MSGLRRLRCILWLLMHRWPLLLVVPLYAYAGYTWSQVLAFSAALIVFTELLHACVLHSLRWD